MRCAKWAMVGLVVIGLFTETVWAEETDAKDKGDYWLREVLVTAPRGEDQVPSYVQDVVTREDLDIPTVSDSIVESLRNEAGIQLMRSGVAGSESGQVRLRGFDDTRFRVLVDGNPLQRDGSYGTGPVEWSILSSEDVERIEITRGAGPARFGNTLGGVLNIVTKKPTDKPETIVSSVYGSLNTWDSSVSHRWKLGPLGWDLAYSHYQTDGFLRNNSFDRDNFAAKLSCELLAGFEVGAGIHYADSKTAMAVYNLPDSPFYDSTAPRASDRALGGPGIGSFLNNGAYGWGDGSKAEDESLFANAYVSRQFEGGQARLSYLFWNTNRHEIYTKGGDRSEVIYDRTTRAEDGNWQVLGDVEYTLGAHLLDAGGTYREYGWGDQSVSFIDTTAFKRSIAFRPFITQGFKGQPKCLSYAALYLQDTWHVHPSVDLEFGLRGEIFRARRIDPDAFGFSTQTEATSLEEENIDPRVAVTWRPWKGGALQGRFGVVHRYPTSPEYFWWYLNKGDQLFNTDLKVEEALQGELSYEQAVGDVLTAFVRGYYYVVDDYITSTTVSGRGQVVYNIGEVTIQGLELGIRANLPYGLTPWANLTLQRGEKQKDPYDVDNILSSQLPDLPEQMLNFGIDYHYQDSLKARLALNYVASRQHIKDREIKELDPYTYVSFSASYRFFTSSWSQWEALFSAENILDQDYEQKDGYPMPGATLIGGLRLKF